MANGNHQDRYDPKISLGNILSFFMVLALIVGSWMLLQEQVTENKVNIQENRARMDRNDTYVANALERLEQGNRRIEEKLDRYIEREN